MMDGFQDGPVSVMGTILTMDMDSVIGTVLLRIS